MALNQITKLVSSSGDSTEGTGGGTVSLDTATINAIKPPATQPVSGTVAVSSLPSITVANGQSVGVTGTFWQATQPVSLATNTPDVTDRAGRLLGVVSGPLTDAQLRATPPAVRLGSTTGKTLVGRTGVLASTAAAADQVVATYTVTAAKTLYISYFECDARLTTFAATATNFGTWSLQINGVAVHTGMIYGAGASAIAQVMLAEPHFVAAGTVVRIVVTPAATTAMTWRANFGGYEI